MHRWGIAIEDVLKGGAVEKAREMSSRCVSCYEKLLDDMNQWKRRLTLNVADDLNGYGILLFTFNIHTPTVLTFFANMY